VQEIRFLHTTSNSNTNSSDVKLFLKQFHLIMNLLLICFYSIILIYNVRQILRGSQSLFERIIGVMSKDKIDNNDLSSLGELAAVDEILADAAHATDEGDYKVALEGFEQALKVARRVFGDNIELHELKHKIADIHELLLLDEQADDEEDVP